MLKRLFSSQPVSVDEILKQHTQTIVALKARLANMAEHSKGIEDEISVLIEKLRKVNVEHVRSDSYIEALSKILV